MERVVNMNISELQALQMSFRLSSIKSTRTDTDASESLPEDTLWTICEFLAASDLHTWQLSCRTNFKVSGERWRQLGQHRFRNILLSGESFEEVDERSSWYQRYAEFSKSLQVVPKSGVISSFDLRTVVTAIPQYRKVSCTLPTRFSVSAFGTTFIRLTVGVKFSPEAVRSVVGLIEGPIEDCGTSLNCDRGLSLKHWGLAFGPLTGVVSSQGRYFDDFSTYRARHGLRDYLALATQTLITVQVGILIHNSKVAFFRLPERDYPDWECTGFVYQLEHAQVFPALMFSQVGGNDIVSVCVNSVSEDPPYWPHINGKGMDFANWNNFAQAGLEAATRPPPNSPMFTSSIDEDGFVLVNRHP